MDYHPWKQGFTPVVSHESVAALGKVCSQKFSSTPEKVPQTK